MTKTSITFQDRVYTRDPLSPLRHRRVYYWARNRSLHRDIWEDFWGPIPEKRVVHHINGDPLDNRVENLALMTAGAHARHHWAETLPVTRKCRQCRAPFTKVCSHDKPAFCSNACKSAWRRASGLDDEKRTCTRCGGTFTVNRYAKQEHCSYQCAGRGTYQRQTFAFICAECGSPATAHDARARFCSNACGKRHRRRKRLDQTAV
jgi:HNH endonuclease